MHKTKQRCKKQFSELQLDLEIINPIKSKTILGGDLYDVTVTGYLNRSFYYPRDAFNPDWLPVHDQDPWDNWGEPAQYNENPSYPDHICQQYEKGSTCVPMTLSYLANYWGGFGIASSDFAEYLGKN